MQTLLIDVRIHLITNKRDYERRGAGIHVIKAVWRSFLGGIYFAGVSSFLWFGVQWLNEKTGEGKLICIMPLRRWHIGPNDLKENNKLLWILALDKGRLSDSRSGPFIAKKGARGFHWVDPVREHRGCKERLTFSSLQNASVQGYIVFYQIFMSGVSQKFPAHLQEHERTVHGELTCRCNSWSR